MHFHICRWLTQLLRTSRLDALMAKHVEMSTEIKSLDSDMQMLVYENYNKFISATDTIRSMKSNVDGMDSNMHELKGLIGQGAAGIVVLQHVHTCKTACTTSGGPVGQCAAGRRAAGLRLQAAE